MVTTLEKQLSQLSTATPPTSSNALPDLRGAGPGRAVREDSKLGMLGTLGKGEVLTPTAPSSGLKLLANSALEGSAAPPAAAG